jgi:hypothetical protein
VRAVNASFGPGAMGWPRPIVCSPFAGDGGSVIVTGLLTSTDLPPILTVSSCVRGAPSGPATNTSLWLPTWTR